MRKIHKTLKARKDGVKKRRCKMNAKRYLYEREVCLSEDMNAKWERGAKDHLTKVARDFFFFSYLVRDDKSGTKERRCTRMGKRSEEIKTEQGRNRLYYLSRDKYRLRF